MGKDEKCYFIRQAQNYFIAWAKGLNYEPENQDILRFANRYL